MDYLERAYHDPWDFSFSGESFSSHPTSTSETPEAASAASSGVSPAASGRPAVPHELVAVVAAGAAMVATNYFMKGLRTWARAHAKKKAQQERERAALNQA